MTRELVDEIITLIQSHSNNNPPPKYCKIIANYDDAPYSDVEVEDLGKLIHKKTIGSTNIGSEGIICFLNGNLDDSIVITSSDLSPVINEINENLKNYASKSELLDMIYPIGSIYLSVNNVNPANLFGGSWDQIKDTFLLASGNTYANGGSGGEAKHKLTTDEIPSHTHIQDSHNHGTGNANTPKFLITDTNVAINGTARAWASTKSDGTHYVYASSAGSGINEISNTGGKVATNQNTGGGKEHNNMPPYLVVNVWKRTA